MSEVKSKNLYELLGNTSDQDSDREPDPPTKAVDKPAARQGKRDAPKPAPAATPASTETSSSRGRGGNRRGGFSGSEAAFRDRATGRNYNRDRGTGEGGEDLGKPGREHGPGARRGRGGPRRGGDRHSRTGVSDHDKQVGHGWGEQTGEGEWADERAGDAIANKEVKEGGWDAEKNEAWDANNDAHAIPADGTAIPEAEPEPEDTSKSYADYLAEKAAKKLEGLGLKEARAPNEGAKDTKKWKSGKELTKEDDENYFKGEDKSRRERDRTRHAKEFVDIDYSFKEQPRESRGGGRGGRGRGRGGERGEFRGGRGGRGGRGDFEGRGRGDRAERGEYRGGRGRGRGGDGSAPVVVNDESAFPSLGSK